ASLIVTSGSARTRRFTTPAERGGLRRPVIYLAASGWPSLRAASAGSVRRGMNAAGSASYNSTTASARRSAPALSLTPTLARIGSMTGIVPSGQGHLLTARGNVLAFKAVAAQTSGDFSLMERTVPVGARTPPAHRHVNCSEAFFVLSGTITFR